MKFAKEERERQESSSAIHTYGGLMKKALAFDMGATSIRGIIGYIEDGKLITKEVMRLQHRIVEKDGRLRWQWDKLIEEVKRTIIRYGKEISSIGIETWGVDFGIIDKEGKLICDPISYRDGAHAKGFEEACKKLGEEEIFLATGNQIMQINTLFQLLALKEENPDQYRKADKILMMPDLFQYILCGEKVGEETIWSTSQLMDLREGKIATVIQEGFDICKDLFPMPVKAGYRTGTTRNSVIEELREFDIEVISVCGHDTASAVLLTEAFKNRDCMFLSCGTWSLLGAVTKEARIDKEVYQKNLTNERGYGSENMFFKNITGLYLLEKYKSQLEEQKQRKIDFEEITDYVLSAKEGGSIIDMDDPSFAAENVNAKAAIDAFLERSGQELPRHEMEYFKIIYESLTQKYLETKKSVEEVLAKEYKKLHMIGGGAKSKLLCKMIAKKLGVELIAGPFEASALGNLLVQIHAKGEIGSMEEGVQYALKTEEIQYYS